MTYADVHIGHDRVIICAAFTLHLNHVFPLALALSNPHSRFIFLILARLDVMFDDVMDVFASSDLLGVGSLHELVLRSRFL